MKKWNMLLLLAVLVILAGCAGSKDAATSPFKIWYIASSEDYLESSEYEMPEEEPEALIQELLRDLASEEQGRIPLLDDAVYVRDFKLEGGSLTLDLSADYKELPRNREILVRAGLVRTLVQIPDVHRVGISVNEQPLRDSNGGLYGFMTADSFVENSGADLNKYQYVTLSLYFANETGTRLVKENRIVAYSTSKPLERVVVEQLVNGPEIFGHTRVLPEGTNILNVTSSEQIAYVNFDNTFHGNSVNVAENITIYAVVNSIIENCKDTKVQFSVNGQSDVMYRDTIDLGHFFEADYSLLEESRSKEE